MATTAFLLLLLAALVALGRPPGPLTAQALPAAAVRGVLVLSRLSDQRRARRAPRADQVRVPSAPDRVPAPC